MRVGFVVTLAIGWFCFGAVALRAQEASSPPPASPAGDNPAATQPATRPADPLETPVSAIEYVFEQIQAKNVQQVREAVIDPPPAEQLSAQVHRIASNLERGASWQVVEAKVQGDAAAVLYRSRYLSGREEVAYALLFNRYDRWKMVLGEINPKRLTSTERQDAASVLEWANAKVKELNQQPSAASTQPAEAKPQAEEEPQAPGADTQQ